MIDRRRFLSAVAAAGAAGLGAPADALPVDARPTADDPLDVRRDFPVAADRVYLNSAYITPVPRAVVDVGRAFIEAKATSPIPLGDMLAKADVVRGQFARLVGAGADEIGFLFATSEGENIVANALDLGPGDNVVIDELHYETEFVLYRHLAKTRGVELRVAKAVEGAVHPRAFEPLVDRRTRLVSISWVSHVNGFRHDVRAIADLAHANGALLYADAIQAVGMFPIDVRAQGVDVLCCGTYKWLLGGFGVAPFYVRRDLLDRIRLDRFGALHVERELPDGQFALYQTAKRYDYATLPFAEVYQLGAGLAYLERVGVDKVERHTVALARTLRSGIDAQGHRLLTPAGNDASIVTFVLRGAVADARSAFARASIDVTVREATRQVRVSPALFNTDDDIRRFLEVARALV